MARILLVKFLPGADPLGQLPAQDGRVVDSIMKHAKIEADGLFVTYPGLEAGVRGAMREARRRSNAPLGVGRASPAPR